jgi:transposase
MISMAYGYMQRDREQLFLLPPSMLDRLEEGHLAYFLIDAVGLLDTSAFHEAHPTEGAGRSAYDPEMMLTALLYAYTTGMRSSRAIEAACPSDLAFRAICVNHVPHFTTIARFRAENEAAIRRSSSGS